MDYGKTQGMATSRGPSLIWSTLDKLGTLIGGSGVALLAIDGLLATTHQTKVVILVVAIVVLGVALILGVTGILGQYFADRKYRDSQIDDTRAPLKIKDLRHSDWVEAPGPHGPWVISTDKVDLALPAPESGYRYGASIWAQPWWNPSRRPAIVHVDKQKTEETQ